jgi:P-type Cu+ transporter
MNTNVSTIHSMALPVRGMTCASCVNHVERALKGEPGVHSASVNLATEKANVQFDTTQTNPAALIKKVAEAGYQS